MAKIEKIEVSLGMSFDMGGVWVKPAAKIQLKVGEHEDLSNEEHRRSVFERAFEVLENEIDDEIKRLENPTK